MDSHATHARIALAHIALSGSVATVAYVLLVVLSRPVWLVALIVFVFAGGLSVGSIAIWRLLSSNETSELLAMLSAASNTIAGALFVAMALVQINIKDVADPPDESLRAVYWGLDVAWDLYLSAGTLGFAVAFLRVDWFRRWAIPGIVVALALFALNIATFPEPPASAGLVDVGPLVGLWYFTIALRAIFILRNDQTLAAAPDG
jgi:hypothetical protein